MVSMAFLLHHDNGMDQGLNITASKEHRVERLQLANQLVNLQNVGMLVAGLLTS